MLPCCKKRLQGRSQSAAQQSWKAINHDVKKTEEHPSFFAFILTKWADCVRDPSSRVGDTVGRACPPAAKEEVAKCF